MKTESKLWFVIVCLCVALPIIFFMLGAMFTLAGIEQVVSAIKVDNIQISFNETKLVDYAYDKMGMNNTIQNKLNKMRR
jgi:uncharacterized membrane protein